MTFYLHDRLNFPEKIPHSPIFDGKRRMVSRIFSMRENYRAFVENDASFCLSMRWSFR